MYVLADPAWGQIPYDSVQVTSLSSFAPPGLLPRKKKKAAAIRLGIELSTTTCTAGIECRWPPGFRRPSVPVFTNRVGRNYTRVGRKTNAKFWARQLSLEFGCAGICGATGTWLSQYQALGVGISGLAIPRYWVCVSRLAQHHTSILGVGGIWPSSPGFMTRSTAFLMNGVSWMTKWSAAKNATHVLEWGVV
jgi:hypothetical protein